MEKLKELGLDDEFGANLLKIGMPIKDIMKATGLSKKQITTLM